MNLIIVCVGVFTFFLMAITPLFKKMLKREYADDKYAEAREKAAEECYRRRKAIKGTLHSNGSIEVDK